MKRVRRGREREAQCVGGPRERERRDEKVREERKEKKRERKEESKKERCQWQR